MEQFLNFIEAHQTAAEWDNEIPSAEYFAELRRVSKHQIIFGGNYFTEHLPPRKGWIFWYKGQNDLSMSDGELIWTSLDIVTRQIQINRGVLNTQKTIHPTEKPIKLYKELLTRYAKPGYKILDTHGGSFGIAIACHDLGFELTACEKDQAIYDRGVLRTQRHIFSSIQFPGADV